MLINSKVNRHILLGISVAFFIVLSLLMYAEWSWGGKVKTKLEVQYIPTAQQLFQNPSPTPGFVQKIVPLPSSVITQQTLACITIDPQYLSALSSDVTEWTRIYVNNQRISRSDYTVAFTGALTQQGTMNTISFCLKPKLDEGFHIIEIRVGTSISALIDPNHAFSYVWSYEIR